jgi:anti-sigma B factor antagonist
MNLTSETFGSVIVIHSPEDLSAEQAPGFEAHLRNVEPPCVVLDIDDTELLDSAGLAAILDARDALRDRQGDLKIATNNATNRKILEITRLDEQVALFESVIDAVKSYQE